MGILDDLTGSALGSMLGGGNLKSTLVNSVLGMLTNQQSGGLEGLVKSFSQKGLGDIVNSWVSTGANLPINAEQIQHALGSQQLSQIADQAGVPVGDVASHLAELLPTIVDKLTPHGSVPRGDMLQQALGFLKGKL